MGGMRADRWGVHRTSRQAIIIFHLLWAKYCYAFHWVAKQFFTFNLHIDQLFLIHSSAILMAQTTLNEDLFISIGFILCCRRHCWQSVFRFSEYWCNNLIIQPCAIFDGNNNWIALPSSFLPPILLARSIKCKFSTFSPPPDDETITRASSSDVNQTSKKERLPVFSSKNVQLTFSDSSSLKRKSISLAQH